MPVIDTSALVENRVAALRDYHQATGIERAELDVSGGVDSAVMLALLARALGPEQITAVYIGIHSGEEFRERALESAAATGTRLIDLDATQVFDELHASLLTALEAAGYDLDAVRARMAQDPAVNGSIRSCLRAPIGRGLNRLTGGGIRHGTGNECEDRFLRFYQKGGDGEVDSNPLAMLTKGEVFQLARVLDVPRRIRAALPSPDLHGVGEAHNDEDELRQLYGVHWTYSKVDPESGEYTYVGNIERAARFVDQHPELFEPAEPDWNTLVAAARADTFRNAPDERTALDLLRSARRIETQTRHKLNPNCPTLGTRTELLAAGILTDELPQVPD
jgi:NAD+ synthetase